MAEHHLLLFFRQTDTCIGDAHFHIFIRCFRSDSHAPAFGGELSGVVGHCVDHEERERLVGFHDVVGVFHLQIYALQLESHASTLHHVEEFLQRKTLHAQVDVALSHLNPACQHIVVVVDAVGQFGDVREALVAHFFRVLALQQPFYFVGNSVDKGHNAIGQRHLGPLLKVAFLVLQHLLTYECRLLFDFLALLFQLLGLGSSLLLPLLQGFEQRNNGKILVALAPHAMEHIEQRQHKANHHHDSCYHQVQLA